MDKRYQIFVSSTFRDLVEERQAVVQALLEMDAIPAGMELFPATNDDAWTLIERVIAQSDYYVLIIGGRYGSTDAEGISYTEREYEKALKLEVPVLAFLHERPDDIPAGKTELDPKAREKLAAFRAKVEAEHHCKYWNGAEQLGSRVSRALLLSIKSHPRTGWIRADEAGSPEALAELNRLRLQIDDLKDQLRKSRTEPPKGSDDLLQGSDAVPVGVRFNAYTDDELKRSQEHGYSSKSRWKGGTATLSWDDAFSAIGPLLLHESNEGAMKRAVEQKEHQVRTEQNAWYRVHEGERISISDDDFQAIKVQLIALGLIQMVDRKRAVSDTATYWKLTPYGEAYLMKLRAFRKESPSSIEGENLSSDDPEDEGK